MHSSSALCMRGTSPGSKRAIAVAPYSWRDANGPPTLLLVGAVELSQAARHDVVLCYSLRSQRRD
jgi:hypothetical protein